MKRRRLLLPVAGLVTLAACAKMAPPPGGEVDDDPPVVLLEALSPPRGAAAVPPDSAFVIAFSERTNHRSVMRALRIFPPVTFEQVEWRGDTLRLRPDGGWPLERSTLVRIEGSVSDNRGNLLGRPFQTTFTTKAVPDSGRITGRAWAGRELTQARRLLVLAWTPDDAIEAGERWPVAIADAASGKEFRLEGLDTARPWRVTAVIEGDGGLRGEEPGGVERNWPDMILFPEGERDVSIGEFLVGTLDTLGAISGEVRADSARVAIVVARPASEVVAMAEEAAAAAAATADLADTSLADTGLGESGLADSGPGDGIPEERRAPPRPFDDWILGATLRSPPTGTGAFTLNAPTGEVYRLGAFVDVDADSIADPDEPRVALDRDISLRFVSKADGLRFDLRGLAPWPAPAESAAADSLPGEGETDRAPEEGTGP